VSAMIQRAAGEVIALLPKPANGHEVEGEIDRSTVGTWLGPAEIFGPLPAVNAVLSELDIAVGAPVIVAGYGYNAKTLSCQSFVTALAAGCRVWGRFEVGTKLRRVAHVDGEQGRRLTCERYQRLANGMGIEPADVGDRIQLVVMPRVRLDSPHALDAWCAALEGFDVAFFDSLRALAPSIEENSSDIRRPLDMLGAVSERTGCANLVIHHARKPQKDSPGGAKMAIRGSGAIFDAASSVLIFGGEKGKPVLVQHEKARNTGLPHDDFQLEVEDVANAEGDPRWGLRVVAADVPEAPTANERFAGMKARILEACRTEDLASKNAIVRSVGGTKSTVLEAITELMAEGALTYVSDRFRPKGAK
jgi:hypothetical protein